MWRKLYACPDCLGLPQSAVHIIEASAAIHTPQQGSWYSWFPPVNTCIDQINQSNLAASEQFSSVAITGFGNVNLNYDTTTATYLNSNISSAVWDYNNYYSLETSDFTVQNALRTPDAPFTSLEPAMAFTEYGFSQGFSKSNFTVLWEPYGTTDYILFLLEVIEASGNANYVLCLTEDIGGFTLDYALLAQLPTGEASVVHLYRMSSESIHPQNNQPSRVFQQLGVLGQDI